MTFEDILGDVTKLWKWIAGAAVVPLAAHLVSISPPWPDAIAYITAIFELLLIIWAYHNLKGAAKKYVSRVINIGIPILFALIIAYLFLISTFMNEVVASDHRYLRGYECTAIALRNYAEQCPNLDSTIFEKSEYDPNILWTSKSLAIVRASVNGTWILFFSILSAVLAAFAVREREVQELTNTEL